MAASGPAAFVEVAGQEYEARDFAWESSVIQLADQWSVTLPAPNGRLLASDGTFVPAHQAVSEGALVRFYESDPLVSRGERKLKMTGRLVTIDDEETPDGGYLLRLGGYDLGWHLTTGCGKSLMNYRSLIWTQLLSRLCGISINADGSVFSDSFGWGFQGVRLGNLENKKTRIGPRAAFDAQVQFYTTGIPPRFQVEVGQSIGPLLVEMAKWQKSLVNVSADGWLQFFRPDYQQGALYEFHHHLAGTVEAQKNNVSQVSLRRDANNLYTKVECWSTVLFQLQQNPLNPNQGRYHGTYVNAGTLPFLRLDSFTDPNQIGQDKVNARALWRWQREFYDAWEYHFRTIWHSQGGVPFEPDTICSLDDDVRGLHGEFYVSAVRCVRKLPRGGGDRSAGTYAEITLKKPGFLGA